MREFPFGKRYWLPGTIGIIGVCSLASLILIFAPSGSARIPGVVVGVGVAVFGLWCAWALRQAGLVVDGGRLGRRSGVLAQLGDWIDLGDVRLVTESPMRSTLFARRGDALLWSPARQHVVWARLLRATTPSAQRNTLTTLEAEACTLYPFVVQYGALPGDAATELLGLVSSRLEPPGR